MSAFQYPLALLDRPADEILEERLRDLVAEFNAEVDPAERVELHQRITRLRQMLGEGGM